MTNKLNEQISALLDNELSDHETASILTRLGQDDDLRQRWDRYHLIGDVMRGESVHIDVRDISERVRSMVALEPAIISFPKKKSHTWKANWLKPAAGAALAASVATVVILTAPGFLGLSDPDQPALATISTQDVPTAANIALANVNTTGIQQMSPAAHQTISGTRWKNLQEPSLENRLNGYLVDHSEYVTTGAGMRVMPYATFVGYDSKH